MQSINSQLYKGKRIRLSGLVKSEEVTGWAGLWMRVDQETSAVAFDNMQNRPIKGTTGWHRYEVVLNVAPDSTAISFGILLSGTGEVWLNSAKLEIVGLDTPLSSSEQKANDRPVNLDFAQ
jgi:hypothetical protein